MDGAYPECSLGFAYHYNIPFMYINTVGFYTGNCSLFPKKVCNFAALTCLLYTNIKYNK